MDVEHYNSIVYIIRRTSFPANGSSNDRIIYLKLATSIAMQLTKPNYATQEVNK